MDNFLCAKCREYYRLQEGICQKGDCGVGQVADPETGECNDCYMGCKTCSTEDPEICNSCTEGYFLYRQQCRRHCPQKTYEDRGRDLCLACPAPCTDCRSDTVCLACAPGHFLNKAECVKQCPVQTITDASGRRCVSCHSSCLSCHGPRASDCDLCLSGHSPLHGQCPSLNCPQGQYYEGLHGVCNTCNASCKTCFGPQSLDCTSCFTGYMLNQDGACVDQCPPGSFSSPLGQLCEDCSPNCNTCQDSSDNCVSCPPGLNTLFLFQGRCLAECPEGFFETEEGLCQPCDVTCLTCDVTKTQCLSCGVGFFLEAGLCRLNCSLGSYPGDGGTCRRCPAHCDVCSDDRTCYKCSFLYLMLDGKCKASCPVGYYEDMEEGRCGLCHLTCSSCSGPLVDDCESCTSSTPQLYMGACYRTCPNGTYFDSTAAECQECHQTCGSCSGPESRQCTRCVKGLVLDPSSLLCGVTGDTACPQRTYLHVDQFTCLSCHHLCQSCAGPGDGECQTCAMPRYLHNGSCVVECPTGSYPSTQEADRIELGFCFPCDHICSTCTGASPKHCLTCAPGYLRLLHLCVSHCPTGYYNVGSACERCAQSCEQCSDPEACSICPSPLLELQGAGLCVKTCPDRFYRDHLVCKRCHISCRTCTDATPQDCVTCDRGSTLQNKVCYPLCEEGLYFSQAEVCEPCDSSCRHCVGPGANHCVTCPPEYALHATQRRCAPCCQPGGPRENNTTACCTCDLPSALCAETPTPLPWSKEEQSETDHLDLTSVSQRHASAALPVALLLALGVGLGAVGLVRACSRRSLCWAQRYERLGGSNMEATPHGVPQPDSGDEADVVYTSRDGSVCRRCSFIHNQDRDGEDDNIHLILVTDPVCRPL
ncbi:proprotein convertase subtilisin/kexin type 5 [Esox lucius]|uniref:proprotein convertase subtilisin/kexin type 5 n=1 Tax=Esox lucius TaxID=8010 RepID=UPI001476DE31|nr:proprotein convertase subtilisin/kexin type 5 [Esox lucius]